MFSFLPNKQNNRHAGVKYAVSSVSFAVLTGAIFIAHPLAQADPVAPTVAQIFDAYINATGGKAAYARLTSTVTIGTFSITGQKIKGSYEVQAKAPDKIFVSQTIEGLGKTDQGYDGTTGWSRDPINGLRVLSGAELTQLKEQARFNGLLFWKEMYPKTEVLGIRPVGSAKAYAVRLTPAGGKPMIQYFDVTTKLMVRQDQMVESPQGSIPTESYPSNWKAVDGVKQPYTMRQVIAGSNEIITTSTSIKNNTAIPDSIFAKPAATTPPKK